MAALNIEDTVGRIGILLSSGKRYIIRKVILKEDGQDRSEVDIAFERPFGGGWEKYTRRLPIQTLREATACNPFGDDYERPSEVGVHAKSDDGSDKLDGESAAPHMPRGIFFPQYLEGDWS